MSGMTVHVFSCGPGPSTRSKDESIRTKHAGLQVQWTTFMEPVNGPGPDQDTTTTILRYFHLYAWHYNYLHFYNNSQKAALLIYP